MNEFLEFDESKKTIKAIILDNFSIEDLNQYIVELKDEIVRADQEIVKKKNLKNEAEQYFK